MHSYGLLTWSWQLWGRTGDGWVIFLAFVPFGSALMADSHAMVEHFFAGSWKNPNQ